MRTKESFSVSKCRSRPNFDITVETTAGLRQPAVVAPAFGDHGEELVAVDQMAALVHDHHPVGVAVERDADIGAHFADLAAERLGRGRAAVAVDVEAVRFDADRHDVGAESHSASVSPPRRSGASMTTRKPSSDRLRGSVRLANSM